MEAVDVCMRPPLLSSMLQICDGGGESGGGGGGGMMIDIHTQ